MPKILATQCDIQRQNLASLFDDSRSTLLVEAPAGFAKTTTVQQWISQRQYDTCWLSMHTYFDNRFYFWRNLIEQLAISWFDPKFLDLFDFSHQNAVTFFPQILKQYLDNQKEKLSNSVLVFDDIHKLKNPEVLSALANTIQIIQAYCRVIVVGRHCEHFSLISGTCRGQVRYIAAKQLAFTSKEVYAYFNQNQSTKISEKEAKKIHLELAGWPIAIALVKLHHENGQNDEKESWHNSLALKADSLAPAFEEMFSHLAKDTQLFLCISSLFSQFCPALIGAVLEKPIENEWLDICKKQLFLREDKQQKDWFQLHDLFINFLQIQFARLPIQQQRHYYVRAGEWFYERQNLETACRFFSLAEQWSRFTDSLSQLFDTKLADGEHFSLFFIINKLPKAIIHDNPIISIIYAWSLPDSQKLTHGFSYVQQALKRSETLNSNDKETLRLRCMGSTLLAFFYFWKGEILLSIKYNRVALKFSQKVNCYLKTRILNTLGQCYFHIGWMPKTEVVMRESLATSIENGRIYDISVSLVYFLESLRLQGKCQEALDIYDQTVKTLAKNDFDSNPKYIWLRNPLIPLYFEHGRLDEAHNLLDETENILSTVPVNVTFLSFYLMRTMSFVIEREWQKAKLSLASWETVQREIKAHIGIGKSSPDGFRALLHLWSGQLSKAKKWAQDSQYLEKATDFKSEDDKLVYLRILIDLDSFSDLSSLHNIRKMAKRQSRLLTVMVTYLLEAKYYYQRQNTQQALRFLDEALAISAQSTFIVSFLAEGPFTLELLKKRRKALKAKASFDQEELTLSSHEEKLLATGEKLFAKQKTLSKPLTPKEKTVLSLIAKGLRDQEIADHLSVSLGTAKTHTRNIYRKLGVNNRSHAVYAADKRELW